MKPEKECWICHRKLSEVIEAGNKIGYDPIICPDNQKEIKENAMVEVNVLGRKVAVCGICRDIIDEVARDNLLDALRNGTGNPEDDIITCKDLEHATLKVQLGEW